MNGENNGTRSMAAVLQEMKDETKQFVRTRTELLKSELQEKLPNLKIAATLATCGVLVLATAYFLLTVALAAAIAGAFNGSDYRWAMDFASVGVLWGVLGGVALYFAKREFKLKGSLPNRTIGVVKGDKIWIEREAKNQI